MTTNNNEALQCPRGEDSCQFLQEILTLRREVSHLAEMVRTDALTGLFNFRFFQDTIELEMERTRRSAQPLAMIMVDIDHFKSFNDTWGHDIGNQALIHVANLIKLAVRKLDYACRFGGEEFVILLPNTDLRQAISVAERLREMIAQTPLVLPQQEAITMTASLGVDQFLAQMSETSDAFVKRTDSWLYSAKRAGRNQVAHPVPASKELKESVTLEEKDALFNLLSDD